MDLAQLSRATLLALGMNEDEVVAVPAPEVYRDRTLHSALAVRKWMLENDVRIDRMNLVSLGPHARRSASLFQEAFGDQVEINEELVKWIVFFETDKTEAAIGFWYEMHKGIQESLREF